MTGLYREGKAGANLGGRQRRRGTGTIEFRWGFVPGIEVGGRRLVGVLWTLGLNAGLAGAGYFVARDVFGQPRGWPRVLGAVVLSWSWLTVGMELLGTAGFLTREALLGWVGLGLALAGLGWVGRSRSKEATPDVTGPGSWGWEGILAAGLVVWAGLTVVLPSLLGPVKVVSDGPIYHLYFAARWWKAGRLELIATPFGESAATYFPAIGDLWFTWLMVGYGGDLLAKVGQVPFLLVAAATAYALARRLGADRPAAVVATAWFGSSAPLLLFSGEANVDTIFVAGYLLACFFFLRHALGDRGITEGQKRHVRFECLVPGAKRSVPEDSSPEDPGHAALCLGHPVLPFLTLNSDLVLGALAAGCALGTKSTGVVFIPPLIVLGLASALGKENGWGRKASCAGAVVAAVLATSGYWFGRNLVLTGNPLYPLQISLLGKVRLVGWFEPGVMRFSKYYLHPDDLRALGDILLAVLDPRLAPVWLAAGAGAWAWGAKGRSALDRWVWAASGLAVLNVALYWVVIPYRTQQRFMLQALGLAVVPLARTFGRSRVACWAGVLLLAAHLLTHQGWPIAAMGTEPPWDLSSRVPNAVPAVIAIDLSRRGGWLALGMSLLLAAAALVTTWAWSQASRRPGVNARLRALAFTLGALGLATTLLYPWGADPRFRFYPPFPDYFRGWLELEQRSGPTGVRVAYAGTNIPYYLMGVGLRNEVRYINIDAHPDWLLHNYHLEACRAAGVPANWDEPRPGWDRIHPDYEGWLANLRAERIQLLVVTRANPEEGRHNVADLEGFPIERRWAETHPEVFEPLYGVAEREREFRLYRLRNQPGS